MLCVCVVDADIGEPDQVVVSIPPVWNNFVFFEVTPASFHQVHGVSVESVQSMNL